ncbi:ISL3 family transposase [Dactylosporangium matsuzakiense]|uniref:Transposase n=1 Tax=Dactylosporangium matsuzakiense TaxID=53360 RepID=A0A9W6KRH6_9ACTN|nr:ISL3 family transposase [Dactylosporangium matsuzakiense]GLL05136.1 transposase [Dactylosporangium matsuzakiense]
MAVPDLIRVLFPHLAALRLIEVRSKGMSVRLSAEAAAAAACPSCGTASRRVHSRYERRLLDGAAGSQEVILQLRVRRFFCAGVGCVQKIFSEQVDGVTVRHGRHSLLMRRLLQAVALALGGRAGQRLGEDIAVRAGRMTLIRLIRSTPVPAPVTPAVLGVDDFALRRGHSYGTVLIDMATRKPIEVLPDRTADTFAAWLQAHPGVQVICRDRGGAYAEAAGRAAPRAVQVADRWHLLKNLSDAVKDAVAAHRRCLRPTDPPPSAPQPVVTDPSPGKRAALVQARHAEIQQLRAAGYGTYAIVRRLGIDAKTVNRYSTTPLADLLPVTGNSHRSSVLDPYKSYLLQRCHDGVTGTGQLLDEIRRRGFTGAERTLRRYLITIRGTPSTPPAPPPPPSSRTITTWIMRPPAKLPPDDVTALAAACDACSELATIRDVARSFANLLRTRGGRHLTAWADQAEHCGIPQLQAFASGLRKDWNAVVAGLTTAWSSGAVEGNVNRIKMLKRQMFGRANFDLLRQRILLTR